MKWILKSMTKAVAKVFEGTEVGQGCAFAFSTQVQNRSLLEECEECRQKQGSYL
jgi:hypothetical protein